MTPRSSQRCTSAQRFDRTAEARSGSRSRHGRSRRGSARSCVDLRRGGLERVTHAEPAVAEACRAPQRGARLAAHEDRRPRPLHAAWVRTRLRRTSKNSPWWRHRLFGPQPPADLDRFVDAPAARREVEPDGVPLLLATTTRRCRTRSGRRRARSTVCTPRAVVNGWRSPMLNTWVPRRTRSVLRGEKREVRERVVHRRVGRYRRMVLARDTASSTSRA